MNSSTLIKHRQHDTDVSTTPGGDAAPPGRNLHRFANPGRFLRISGRVLPVVALLGLGLTVTGLVWGLFFAPADWQQGDAVRIM